MALCLRLHTYHDGCDESPTPSPSGVHGLLGGRICYELGKRVVMAIVEIQTNQLTVNLGAEAASVQYFLS